MSRLETTLRTLRDGGGKALLPFFTGGYPDRATFVELLLAAQRAGADAIEVGIPFSDPSADGPVIQHVSEQVLRRGIKVREIFHDVGAARDRGLSVPVLYMTYYNPILAFGPEEFSRAARASGADAVLVVDLPAEESGEFVPAARAAGLETVFLVAPTTPASRMAAVLRNCSGFVYCVSVTGVTGEKRPVVDTVRELVERARAVSDLPALVGFGVSGPQAAEEIGAVADGVIVGSALLQTFDGLRGADAVAAAGSFLRSLRRALGAEVPGR